MSEEADRYAKARALQTLRGMLPPDLFEGALRQQFEAELRRFVHAAISLRLALDAFLPGGWRD